jgi:hypothetical protein
MSSPLVKVATLSDFDQTGCHTVSANGHTLALFKYGENIFAVDNRIWAFPSTREQCGTGF